MDKILRDMDKMLRDMEEMCSMTANERAELYRLRSEMTRVSETLLSLGWVQVDGVEIPIEEDWTEQELEAEDLALIRGREDRIRNYEKTPEESLRDLADELQDINLLYFTEMFEDLDTKDQLELLEVFLTEYNLEVSGGR